MPFPIWQRHIFVVFSFHVGSGCWDATAFSAAVASARVIFDIGKMQGFDFDFLDIGGGFPGQKSAKITFEEVMTIFILGGGGLYSAGMK